MRHFTLGAATAAAVALLATLTTSPVRAEIEYPYCGYARLGAGGCTFATLAQCQAFIAGAGGRCERNARYTPGTNTVVAPRARR